jgi:hypothetical protein
MRFIGFVIGLAFGTASGILFHTATTPFSLFNFVVWLVVNLIITWLVYLIGKQGYSSSEVVGADIILPDQVYRFPLLTSEELAFGFFIGVTVATNFVIWLLSTGLVLSVILSAMAVIPALALFTTLSQSRIIQAILGWNTWIMPTAWISAPIGLIIAIVAIPVGIVQNGRSALRIDPTSGAFEVHVNIPSNSPNEEIGGFSIWIFTFVNTSASTVPNFTVGFLARSVSAHESGHTLNTSIFGSFFLLVNWIDQNFILPVGEGKFTLAELYAESRVPGTNSPDSLRSYLPLWSQ